MKTTTVQVSKEEFDFVRILAYKIKRKLVPHADLKDLVGAGCIGLLQAKHSYDASRGVAFNTFAFYRIRGSIFDYIRVQGKVELPPDQVEPNADVVCVNDDYNIIELISKKEVHKLVNALPEKDRSMVIDYFFNGKTLDEIGEARGLSKSWTSRQFQQVMKKLANIAEVEYV